MYCREKMIRILKCYLIPKKVMAFCLRVQFFLANPVFSNLTEQRKEYFRSFVLICFGLATTERQATVH